MQTGAAAWLADTMFHALGLHGASTLLVIVYDTGALRVEDFPRVGVVLCTMACLLYAACAATYWGWLGLF